MSSPHSWSVVIAVTYNKRKEEDGVWALEVLSKNWRGIILDVGNNSLVGVVKGRRETTKKKMEDSTSTSDKAT